MLVLPSQKAPYPKDDLPGFHPPALTEEVVEQYKDRPFVAYTVPDGGLPVVVVIKPDRLHIYDDVAELKYDAFNQDLYAKNIGPVETKLRFNLPGNALFGWIYQQEGPGEAIQLFHVWNAEKSAWLDHKQIGMLQRTYGSLTSHIRWPRVQAIKTLGDLQGEDMYWDEDSMVYTVSVNDPGVIFIWKWEAKGY